MSTAEEPKGDLTAVLLALIDLLVSKNILSAEESGRIVAGGGGNIKQPLKGGVLGNNGNA